MILAIGFSVCALIATNTVSLASSPTAGASASAPGSWKSVVRIKAGGAGFTDSRGLVWSADRYAVGGTSNSTNSTIAGTQDQALFHSERWGATGYNVPVANGSYVLKLYFAEINPSSGARVMSVSSGTEKLLTNFDVAKKVGAYTADVETFDVNVTNGVLPLSLSASSNSSSIAGIELLQTNALSVLRLNSGGPSYSDTRGLQWNADQFETGATGTPYSVSSNIAGTDDAALYQSQQWGMDGYNIPVADGTYILKLYFAEINAASGARVFDVYDGSTALLMNFNIAAKVGNDRADVEQFAVTVTGGSLPLRFVQHENEPSIAAIELLSPLGAVTTAVKGTPAVAGQAVTPTTTAPVALNTPSMSGWHAVASDDFSGNSLNQSKWSAYSGTGNEGVGTRNPSQLKVTNGELDILGQGSVGGGAAFNYSSTYGRYVITARDDVGTGYGPAMLLWPDSEKWPQDGEIDIAEMPEGARTQSHFTVHYGADNSQVASTSSGDFTQWHTWTLEWTSSHITEWLDGKQVATITDAAAIPHTAMHLAVQNDVGAAGHWIPARTSSTPSTVTLHIASVQAYAQN